MSRFDLVVRNGTVVTPAGPVRADIAVEDGLIAVVGPAVDDGGECEVDARGLQVLPGVIDAHVHFNDPGRADWEGFVAGSHAIAAGGGTCFIDMPLNAHPPTVDAAAFDLKVAAARDAALVDFALWGGLVPGSVDRLDELAARGVVGFKAFMSPSGIDDFPAVDDLTLYDGMARAARLGLPVAVHAENGEITSGLAARALAEGRTGVRDFLASRPVVAELEAIERAIVLAAETGCSLHIVHVSTGRGVRRVAAARERGVDVTCETCPHYLALTENDMEQLGVVAKCAPPLRAELDRAELWRELLEGRVTLVASDHSPAPLALKEGADFFAAWGGISGCQSLLRVLVTEGARHDLSIATVAELTASNVAERFRLGPTKGRIQVGGDADLVLLDLEPTARLEPGELLYRHRHSPYVGRTLRARIVRTIVRGTTVWLDGAIVSPPVGRLVKPRQT